MNKNNLPNNLYELRRNCGLSQEEFAEKLGVSRQAVSKWERGEAYPDTENLITISELFSVTIDELLNSNIGDRDPSEDDAPQSDGTSADGKDASEDGGECDDEFISIETDNGTRVKLRGGISINGSDEGVNIRFGGEDNANEGSQSSHGKFGIIVDDEDGSKVRINRNGIFVKSESGEKIKIGKGGISVDEDELDSFTDDDDYELPSHWLNGAYPIITLIAFLILGFTLQAWGWAWTLFMTIPIFSSTVEAVRKRRVSIFSYPVFVAFIYCLFGMLFSWWHPGWVIFITIPVFSMIAHSIDKRIRKRDNRVREDDVTEFSDEEAEVL